MHVSIHPDAASADAAAAELLATWLMSPQVRNVMLAAGNTPLSLYRLIAARGLPLARLKLFALDEYVGVPSDEPRRCAHLIRRVAVIPWGVPPDHYFTLSSEEPAALPSVQALEDCLHDAGGLDVVVLGLGRNGHLGFNEPGSGEDSVGRVVELAATSIKANQAWFGGDYAPERGVTVGLRTILRARRVLVVAYGAQKAAAVRAMTRGARSSSCPASLLQGHADATLFLDQAAAAALADEG